MQDCYQPMACNPTPLSFVGCQKTSCCQYAKCNPGADLAGGIKPPLVSKSANVPACHKVSLLGVNVGVDINGGYATPAGNFGAVVSIARMISRVFLQPTASPKP